MLLAPGPANDGCADDPLDELARKYFGPETPRVNVDLGARTHPGKVRRTTVGEGLRSLASIVGWRFGASR